MALSLFILSTICVSKFYQTMCAKVKRLCQHLIAFKINYHKRMKIVCLLKVPRVMNFNLLFYKHLICFNYFEQQVYNFKCKFDIQWECDKNFGKFKFIAEVLNFKFKSQAMVTANFKFSSNFFLSSLQSTLNLSQ